MKGMKGMKGDMMKEANRHSDAEMRKMEKECSKKILEKCGSGMAPQKGKK